MIENILDFVPSEKYAAKLLKPDNLKAESLAFARHAIKEIRKIFPNSKDRCLNRQNAYDLRETFERALSRVGYCSSFSLRGLTPGAKIRISAYEEFSLRKYGQYSTYHGDVVAINATMLIKVDDECHATYETYVTAKYCR